MYAKIRYIRYMVIKACENYSGLQAGYTNSSVECAQNVLH